MKPKMIIAMIAAALLLAACSGQSQPAAKAVEPKQAQDIPTVAQEAPTQAVVEEVVPTEEVPTAKPVEEETASSGETVAFKAPQDLFSVEVPDNWTKATDTSTIEDSEIDTFTAPDGNAFAQALVNATEVDISAVEKAQYTRDYMKRLYGDDLKFATDVSLKDGREKLEWWSDANMTSGTTYFATKDGYLYFLTVGSKDANEKDYQSALKNIADSYTE
jgi:glucose/arabinose dehydrogenase